MTSTLRPDTEWILSFAAPEAAAQDSGVVLVGGKGANLARLAQAGFPVPGGFLATTRAYHDFVAANGLDAEIAAALKGIPADGLALEGLESVSSRIRDAFAAGKFPPGLADAILAAYRGLSSSAVAVRSSATAEDLPEMSFAGQQDTYLNIVGEDALLNAVVRCWSSLWTARAIGYRVRNHVPHENAALAVVVQCMVESRASGVLFTANPLTGLRSETVIDATLGLGEALVSGQVEPDHYVVDSQQGVIRAKTLGSKAVSLHGQAGGGTAAIEQARGDVQALPDEQILTLAKMGQQVAAMYGAPQDIEWAWADGTLALLQSRAITSLFPMIEGLPPEPLHIFFSFAAIQGLFDPVTPLGRDAISTFFAFGAGLFRIHVNSQTQRVLFTAGERLWLNMTTPMTNTLGRKIVYAAIGFMEPTIKQALDEIRDEPGLQPKHKGVSLHARTQLARFALPLLGNIVLNMASPRKRRENIVRAGEELLVDMETRAEANAGGDVYQRLAQQARFFEDVGQKRFSRILLRYMSGVAAGVGSFNLLRMLALELPDEVRGSINNGWPELVLEAVRGLPNNPTTEMDLELWRMSQDIHSDPALESEFRDHAPAELAQRFRAGTMPGNATALIERFLRRYGMRGLGEIDMGRERWNDNPLHIFEMLSGYLQIAPGEQAPDVVFERGAQQAQAAIDRLVNGLRQTPHGWIKARAARFAASRMREMMGIRESPKFFMVRLMGIVRRELLKSGAELASLGALDQADDLLYLTFREIQAFAAHEAGDWRGLIAARREAARREKLRRQIPRVLLSDGRAIYEGMRGAETPGKTLTGSPVSPGNVEGLVRVVLDPRYADLQPGEIMVCPGTDPSWTPLFLTAAGLVMEVGGMMTHGAVVAREYGLPAVVGVDQATQRLQTGQRIRLNGSNGMIDLLD